MLNEFYESVKLFNDLAGNTDVSIKGFKNQVKLIFEEGVKEAEEALKEKSTVKMLDSTVDALYVVLGNLQKLEALGCDIEGAIKQVCNDNLTKFPFEAEVAQASVLHYNAQNIHVSYTYNAKHKRYIIKDSNGKVRKPLGFTSTDLTKYVPEALQKEGLKCI